jgi:hypothetical protein
MKTRTDEDAEPLLEPPPRLRGVHPLHEEREHGSAAGGVPGAEDDHTRDLLHPFEKVRKQRRFLLPDAVHPSAQQPGKGNGKACEPHAVRCPRLEGVGVEIRLVVGLGAASRPPLDERHERHPFPHKEEAGPLGAQ